MFYRICKDTVKTKRHDDKLGYNHKNKALKFNTNIIKDWVKIWCSLFV